MTELRLDAHHTHLYPGARGTLCGTLPARCKGVTCEVAFSDGAVTLGTLAVENGAEAILETGPYATAAGNDIPAKTWRLEITGDAEDAAAGRCPFRVRAKFSPGET